MLISKGLRTCAHSTGGSGSNVTRKQREIRPRRLSVRTLELLQTEAEFQAKIVAWAKINKWMVFHPLPAKNSRGRWATHLLGDPGFPDLVMVRNGTVLFWEVKAEKGRMSVAQTLWETALRTCADEVSSDISWTNVHHHVVRPSDWNWIEEFL